LTNPSDGEITMRVEIVNDNQNWLNWGNLVLTWIRDDHQRPETVGQLREQMRTYCVEGTVDGRRWDAGVLVPEINVRTPAAPAPVVAPGIVLRVREPRMTGKLVKQVQRALVDAGFEPGPIDGEYGGQTSAAVRAFQLRKGLAVDGEVGRLTAKALGVIWY
jgi:hypothetical protein